MNLSTTLHLSLGMFIKALKSINVSFLSRFGFSGNYNHKTIQTVVDYKYAILKENQTVFQKIDLINEHPDEPFFFWKIKISEYRIISDLNPPDSPLKMIRQFNLEAKLNPRLLVVSTFCDNGNCEKKQLKFSSTRTGLQYTIHNLPDMKINERLANDLVKEYKNHGSQDAEAFLEETMNKFEKGLDADASANDLVEEHENHGSEDSEAFLEDIMKRFEKEKGVDGEAGDIVKMIISEIFENMS